jgi:hypothetical protein
LGVPDFLQLPCYVAQVPNRTVGGEDH